MLDNLLTLPEARHAALALELNLLDRTVEKLGMLPGDLMLAREADLQGPGAPLPDARLQREDA